jgi:phage gp36-like protein
MSYNTPLQFLNYSLCSGSFNGVDSGIVQQYLNVAQTEIDSALIIHHTLPFNSGSVPAVVLEWERVICAYRLFLNMGIDPGTKSEFLQRRYDEIVGDPNNPATGILGMMAMGTRALVDPANGDQEDSAPKPSFIVIGQPPRGWQQSCGRAIR